MQMATSNQECFIRNKVDGELPRDSRGNVLPDRKSDGMGRLRGKNVVVVRGRKLPIGMTGPVRWHGETKYGWRVGIEVEGGVALVWTAAANVDVVEAEEAAPEDGVGDCPF